MMSLHEVFCRSIAMFTDFKEVNGRRDETGVAKIRWSTPSQDELKLNMDGAIF